MWLSSSESRLEYIGCGALMRAVIPCGWTMLCSSEVGIGDFFCSVVKKLALYAKKINEGMDISSFRGAYVTAVAKVRQTKTVSGGKYICMQSDE